MRNKWIHFFLVTVLIGKNSIAQDITGIWKGGLSINGNALPLVFTITKSGTQLASTFDSPAQNAFGISTGSTELKNDSLVIRIPLINGSYTGKWNGADSIYGTFQQGNFKAPMVLLKSKEGKASKPEIKRPQTPQPPFDYSIEEVNYSNQEGTVQFGGTLTLPKNKKDFPTVILISGSGSQDRDGSMFDHKIYWVLADYLTKAGIGVLRVDDRGVGKTSLGPNPTQLTSESFAKDVEAGLSYLKSRKEINAKKLGLIGHSEGGMIAPMVAVRNKNVSFIALLAGPGVPGYEIWNGQMRRNFIKPNLNAEDYNKAANLVNKMNSPFRFSTSADTIKKKMEAVYADWKATNSTIDENKLFLATGINPYKTLVNQFASGLVWLQYFLNYEPFENLSKVKLPVLAINGSYDIQVLANENINGIEKALKKAGNKQYEVKIIPSLNHLFQTAQSPEQSYGSIEESFAPVALEKISNWILSLHK
ncbi:S9 family peptidase [Sediminibacterium sp. C3]|uniref:alpha/beta hydrolase family protein n=1 Tax=Sediminibacterium sp. C3 TaxID=1267211 RepID=UPI00042A46E8|nr:alpha/beta fold hydrolase [Sediminibacterium sp. C3]